MEFEYIMRYILSFLAIAVIINCVWSLIRLRPEKKVYALLVDMANDTQYPINCYETSVGRSRSCDIVFTNSTVSRSHAVVALRKDGFYVFDTESKTGVYVNNEKITKKQKLTSLGEELEYTAKLRLTYDSATLSELAALHQPPITKSGLNHRLKKLLALAGKE